MKRHFPTFAAIFIALAMLAISLWHYQPFTVDDVFISLRYVQRFIHGKGLTWNDGEYVEGYSNFLWVLLISALGYLGMDLLLAARLLGLAATIGTFAILAFSLRTRPAVVVLAALLAFVSCASLAIWSMSGLETPLVLLLLTSAVILSEKLLTQSDNARATLIGYLLGLLCWTRPEAVLYTPLLASGLFLCSRLPGASRIRMIVIIGIVPLIFFLSQLAFRLYFYHQWTANSALAKVSFSWPHILHGLNYSLDAAVSFLPVLFYCCCNTRLTPARPLDRRFDAILLLILFAMNLAITVAGGDIFEAYRFYVPLVPLVVLWFAHCMDSALRHGRKMLEITIIVLVIAAQIVLQYAYPPHRYLGNTGLAEVWKEMGLALKERFPQQPVILTFAAGAIPYYSELPAIDGYGINDAYLTSHRYDAQMHFGYGAIGHELFDLTYITSRKPDVLVTETPGFGDFCTIYGCGDLLKDYKIELLHTPQFDFHVYIRKGSMKVKNAG